MKAILSLPRALSTQFEEINVNAKCVATGCGTSEYEFTTVKKARVAKSTFLEALTEQIVIMEIE